MEITFKQGSPYSAVYDDIYYMTPHGALNGLEESRHVFLDGNDLPDRWKVGGDYQTTDAACPDPGKTVSVIAETGFGTGLNFLATWQLWANSANPPEVLHYISIEKHPISKHSLKNSHQAFPQLAQYSTQLIRQYPDFTSGFQRIWLADYRVCLTLCFMDVLDGLTAPASNTPAPHLSCIDEDANNDGIGFSGAVDHWYLDGFSPSKNPDMWSQPVLDTVAKSSHAGTTLTTFTAAGAVQRGLKQAGFTVSKRPGFGKKREVLRASISAGTNSGSDSPTDDVATKPSSKRHAPWFRYPRALSSEKRAIVIGAGIAGCQTAWHLAIRGWQVTVVEHQSEPATRASGHPAGIISPKVTAAASPGESFYLQCFEYVTRQLHQLQLGQSQLGQSQSDPSQLNPQVWNPCGVLQLVSDDREHNRWQALSKRGLPPSLFQCLDQPSVNQIAGINLNRLGVFFPRAGWVRPQRFCHRLLSHPNIDLVSEKQALELDYEEGRWRACNDDGVIATAPIVVIASGKYWHFEPISSLPCLPVLGQTTRASATEESKKLSVVLDHKGYITPAIEFSSTQLPATPVERPGDSSLAHLLGSSYQRGVSDVVLSSQADVENIQKQHEYLPELAQLLGNPESAHSGVRMVSPDRFPYVGQVPDLDYYQRQYGDLHHGKKWKTYPQAKYWPGLYLCGAFGSRGLTTSALCAELVASMINNDPLPVDNWLVQALHPARHLIKNLKQGIKVYSALPKR